MENNTTEVLKMCNSENNLKEVPNIIQFFKEKIVTLKKEPCNWPSKSYWKLV